MTDIDDFNKTVVERSITIDNEADGSKLNINATDDFIAIVSKAINKDVKEITDDDVKEFVLDALRSAEVIDQNEA